MGFRYNEIIKYYQEKSTEIRPLPTLNHWPCNWRIAMFVILTAKSRSCYLFWTMKELYQRSESSALVARSLIFYVCFISFFTLTSAFEKAVLFSWVSPIYRCANTNTVTLKWNYSLKILFCAIGSLKRFGEKKLCVHISDLFLGVKCW